MQMRWKGRRKLNNKGLTLMELICAIAILAIVTASIGSVMVVSARSYQRDSDEVSLQQEAQVTANQIADLVIDSTAGVSYTCPLGTYLSEDDARAAGAPAGGDRTLSIDGNGHRYVVSFKSAENKIYYAEYILNPDGSAAPYDSEQLMAENVNLFAADIRNFSDNGYMELTLGFEKNAKTYAATFTITARNGAVAVSGAEAAATITTELELVLEPNQTYVLNANVTGPADTDMTWVLSGGSTDPATQVLKDGADWKIIIGENETASEIYLLVQSKAKKEDGVTPQAQQTVIVHIRRVTAVNLNVTLQSGSDLMAGAEYLITADVVGTNLPKLMTGSSDVEPPYVSPYKVEWGYIYSVNGHAVGGDDWTDYQWQPWYHPSPSDYFTVLEELEGSDSTAPSIRIRLLENIDEYRQLLVTATATHPEGTAGAPPVSSNKTGLPYGHVAGMHLFYKALHSYSGEGMYRGTPDAQVVDFAYDLIKGMIQAQYGNVGFLDNCVRYYRFRPFTVNAAGERVYGPWVNWAPTANEYGGAIKMRGDTLRFEFDKNYEVQIKYWWWEGNVNNVVWPFAGMPDDINVVTADIYRAKLFFRITDSSWNEIATGAAKLGTKEVPYVLADGNPIHFEGQLTSAQEMGADQNYIKDHVSYRVEKLEGDAWTAVYETGGQEMYHLSPVTWNSGSGLYRVVVGLKGVPYRTYNYATQSYNATVMRDYWLYDEVSGDGIFYFQVP